MHTLLAVAALAALGAAPAPEGKQIKIAAPGLSAVNLKKDRADFFADHFAQELQNRGIRVITAKEVNAVLGLARTQQLMGCDESSTNCMTELADALGVDGVIAGSVGQFGTTYQANIVIASNGDGKLLSSVTVKADSEPRMLESLTIAARQAASEVGAALGKPARRFARQALYVNVLDLIGGDFNLSYSRALDPRWSITGTFALGLNQPSGTEGVNVTLSLIGAQARFHFLDTPPFGLYLGGGLSFTSGYGYGTDPTTGVTSSIGTSAFALTAEVGYALALFDALHLSLGLGGALGVGHFALVNSNGVAGDLFLPLPAWGVITGLGWAF